MSTILALDTATENCSVALLYKDTLFDKVEYAPQRHTNIILPMLDNILKEANISIKDVDYIAFGHGPGSFTGARIAASVAQGLSFGLDTKLLGVSTLHMMAYEAYEKVQDKEAIYVSAIDARMGEIYLGIYKYIDDVLTLVDKEYVISPVDAIEIIKSQNAKSILCSGTGFALLENSGFKQGKGSDVLFPCARYIFNYIKEHNATFLDPIEGQPVYIRNTVTWKKISEQ